MGRKRARGRDSHPPYRDQPLRRSARLAAIIARKEQKEVLIPEPETPVVDPEVLEPDLGDPAFAMKLVIQPPERVTAGVAFGQPVVVTFTANDAAKEKNEESDGVSQINGVWAYLSLMSEDRSQSLAPPNAELLQGQIADSIHPISQAQSGDVQTVGYAKFPNLIISEPGRYCLRVSIIDMNYVMIEEPFEGAKVLPALHSAPFDVVEEAEEDMRHAQKHMETIAHLREIGVNV